MAGEFLLFWAALVLLAVIGVLVYLHEKKRSDALMRVANELGLSFVTRSRDTFGLMGVLTAMPRGSNPHVRNLMSGEFRGLSVRIFEYVYTTGSGKHQQTRRHETALAQLPYTFPRLTIVPENFGHKFFDALGGDDIDFESDEFSRRYWVRSDDRRFAYDVIHARMMDHIMSPGWDRWELYNQYLVLWGVGTRLDPEEVRAALDRLVAFHELLPGFRKTPSTPSAAAAPRAPPSFTPATFGGVIR